MADIKALLLAGAILAVVAAIHSWDYWEMTQ
jgi:hypothetical protein